MSAFGHKVKHTTLAVLVAGIPVLYGGVFHLCPILYHYLHDGGMQLVLIAHGSSTTFQIGNIGVIVAHYQRALELTSTHGIDAEVGTQLHWASDTLGDVHKTTVGEYSRVQSSKVIVAIRYHRAKVFTHKVGVILYCLGNATEDDSLLLKFLLEGGLYRYAIHNGINRHTCQSHALFQRDTQFVEGLHQFRIYLLGTVLL